MSALYHCIYTSVATRLLSEPELQRLIEHSRMSNRKWDLTGILLHAHGTYFQILEGPQEAIDILYGKILEDTRHTNATKIIYEPIARRYFSDSSMTLAKISATELARVLAHTGPDSRELLLDGLDEGRAKRVLRAFQDGRWRQHLISTPDEAEVRA